MTEKKEDDNSSVRVALRIRPQLAREKIDMCQVCTTVMEEERQVLLGKDKAFTFDFVYDIRTKQEFIYTDSVEKLIDGCLEGYNATVFAYGQTGSGKTYTMGTGFDLNIPDDEIGIIPRAVAHLFKGIEDRKREALEKNEPCPDFKVNAQFMELYNEEILDLLDTTRDTESRSRKTNAKIHEDADGGIYVVGVTTKLVHSLEETIQCLQTGALSRSTASTNMNATSSRSHAIFTLHIKQHRVVKEEDIVSDMVIEGEEGKEVAASDRLSEFETLTAKFHFVDLAGSERLKRTGATGDRQKEGISINCGLLALGNVISALGDKEKKGSHVPYRDSKLTRLLQDSLGGNSRTLMIACVSPSDRDFMETLNTLRYANRARNITNKVIANQDKASKQLAFLRQEIMQLQQELLDYKSGKRIIDSEGVESNSDLYHENKMLQAENDKLRARIKTLNETIERLTAKNAELLAEKALLGLGNAAGDPNSEEVSKLIQGYITDLEELRSKLAESESMMKMMKRGRIISSSRLGLSPLNTSRMFDDPTSPDNSISSLIEVAKQDVKKNKQKVKRSQSRLSPDVGDKENLPQGEEAEEEEEEETEKTEENEEGEIVEKDKSEKSEKDEEDECFDENGNVDLINGEEDDFEDDEMDDTSSDSDSEGKDSDNIHEDLAELTCEISIKQRLIEELEQSQKKLHSMKSQYEEKVQTLVTKIRETEAERDKVLSSLSKVENTPNDQAKKVQERFERKLGEMQTELKKLQAAKKEHAKLVKNQSHYEKQLKTLQHELGEMKKTKVRLMRQIKEDTERNKQSELRRNKEISLLKKEQVLKEGLIRTLEREKTQKDGILRRKQEEVELLRKKNRPMSTRVAGRVGRYDKVPTVPVAERSSFGESRKGPVISSGPSVRRRRRTLFNAKAAKHKWDSIEKVISSVVNKKQTVANIEKDMDVWLKHREKLGKKLEKQLKRKEGMVAAGNSEEEIKEVTDVIESLNNQVEFAQDNINECQSNIVQVEETKEDAAALDPSNLIGAITIEEAKYLLEHFISLSITKGLAFSSKESEARELQAKLHQTELNNTIQQDLLKHMMVDRSDIEVDNLMTSQIDEMESSASSTSSSPVDSKARRKRDKRRMSFLRQALNLATFRGKARRRQATLDDLLYVEDQPPLNPVPETPDEHPVILVNNKSSSSVPPIMSMSDSSVMPPPKTLTHRQNSNSRLVSPGMRRKDYSKPSPSPSPVLRRKNSFTLLTTRSNSLNIRKSPTLHVENATSSDTTPPSSPQPTRRSERLSSDINVFSRLTINTTGISDMNSKRGSIVPASARITTKQSGGPLICTHTAEGHSKAVLCVTATEDLLFSSSKDRTAKCWDLEVGKEILSFSGHPNNVSVVRYCPEQRILFTVSQSYVSVWDIREKTNKCIKTLSSSGLTQDGPVNSSTRQIDLPMGEHHINDIALNKSGSLLYSAGGNVVRVWDLRRFAAIGKLSGGHQAAIMVIGVDQHEDKDLVVSGSKDHYIKVFEVMPEGAGVLTPKYNLEPPHYDGIQSLALQGTSLFSGSRDTCIKKWDLETQTLVQSVNAAHKDWICALDFMNNGNVLLSGCRTGYLKLWQTDTCTQIADIKAHTSPVNSIATNSTAIFTASNDNTVRIWKNRDSTQDLVDSSDIPDEKPGS